MKLSEQIQTLIQAVASAASRNDAACLAVCQQQGQTIIEAVIALEQKTAKPERPPDGNDS